MFAVQILRHTPPWVWLLLAYLIFVGVRRMGMRTQSLTRVWTTPVIFIVMGVSGALARHQPAALAVPAWVAGVLLGAAPGALTSPRHIAYDRAARRVRFRGSLFPLIRNLLIFAAQYGIAVMAATGGGPRLALWAIGVSGASAGYFLGWTGAFLLRLRRAPAEVLTATPA